jgi:hypothetical protein
MAGNNPANNVARWNGNSWSPLGIGTNETVTALAVYNGELYAAGLFDTAGGIPVNKIARWNNPALFVGENNMYSEILISPNPVKDILTITATSMKGSLLEIYNSLGEKIYSQKIISPKTEINLEKHSAGIYFVRLKSVQGTLTKKIILSD